MLFGIDAARDALVRIDPPNAGTLRTVGALGTDIGEAVGFDITAAGNVAYALVTPQGAEASRLVRIDLSNGRAAPTATDSTIDLPEGRLRGLAAAGPVPDDNAAPEQSVAFSSTILEQNTNRLRPSVNCDETCGISVAAAVDGRAAGTGRAAILGPGRVTVPVALNAAARRRIARAGTELITLRITVVDAAGNDRTQTRRSRTQTLAARRAG